MSSEHGNDKESDIGGNGHDKFFFFVDMKKYDWPKSTLTGAELRASVPDLNPTFQIILEGHDGEPDKPVSDSDSFSLESHGRGPLKFYTVPPATFGVERRSAPSVR